MNYKLSGAGVIFFILLFTGCDSGRNESAVTTVNHDTVTTIPGDAIPDEQQADTASLKQYSNQKFREVTVELAGTNKFKVEGKAQVVNGRFGWVIEDGHYELKSGFETTDTGASSWGDFSFTVEAEKERPNSTLHLILFETSGEDGRRSHELPVYLY